MKCRTCGVENYEGVKFCDHCGTPFDAPSTPQVKPVEISSVQSLVSSAEPGRTKLLKLNCPSCGGTLELPDNLTIAHCLYCGTKILLDQDSVVRERRDLSRYIELCKVAVEAKNYKEAIEYCNRILEIDPKNIEAWINKAVATFWLTTGAHNRYDEAMEYLTKASQIAPCDSKIEATRKALTQQQAIWYTHLGDQQREQAQKVYNIYYNPRLYVDPVEAAKGKSEEYAIKAIDYYLLASSFAPDNIVILQKISDVAKFYDKTQWSAKVHAKVYAFQLLRAKTNALGQLPKLKQELQTAQSELAKLQTQSGFFVGIRINDAQSRITRLRADIAKLEKDAAYDPLKVGK